MVNDLLMLIIYCNHIIDKLCVCIIRDRHAYCLSEIIYKHFYLCYYELRFLIWDIFWLTLKLNWFECIALRNTSDICVLTTKIM